MVDNNTKQILIVNQASPYGSSHAKEALDLAFAAAAFDQAISILFVGDGCYQLQANQAPKSIDSKCLTQMLKALPIYGVSELLVDRHSLTERKIAKLDTGLNVRIVSDLEVKDLYQNAQTIIRF